MDPGNVRYLLDAGHACADMGEWERSEYHWRLALRQDEQSEEALTQLAEARRTLHDVDGAKRLLRECLLHHPESEPAQLMLSELEAN
jgi:thioredoxin-like negative regulator of GroEL